MPEQKPAADCPETPDGELIRLRVLTAEQAAQIAQLLQRIQGLEARLAKDSHNSSKPPSSDPPFKKPPPRTLRQRSGKQPGGQKDHPGATRALVEDPEHTVTLPLAGYCACGQVHRSAWPAGVAAPVQYGPGVAALAVYLTHDRQLPYQRTADLLQALAGMALSPATIYAMGCEAAVRLSAPVAATSTLIRIDPPSAKKSGPPPGG